jgi:oxygen-independent coproporphyrinogen-3 oxidase
MCRFKTSWGTDETYFPEISMVKDRLFEMEQDGLVAFGIDGLRVTTEGQPFIRNICMAFDVLLHRKEPETRLFSMTI